jgi:cell division septal protein FtsQ
MKNKEKYRLMNRIIILIVLTLASWGVVVLAFYGAVKIIEIIF